MGLALLAVVVLGLSSDDARANALKGSVAPKAVLERQAVVIVEHLGFDGTTQTGHIVVDRRLAIEVREIFAELLAQRFPIERLESPSAFGWDDLVSMRANNTSGFNYRVVEGTRRLSHHASGRAIDVNPMQNPYQSRDKTGARYEPAASGTLTSGSAAVLAFTKRGWRWGGKWKSKDMMHFEKP